MIVISVRVIVICIIINCTKNTSKINICIAFCCTRPCRLRTTYHTTHRKASDHINRTHFRNSVNYFQYILIKVIKKSWLNTWCCISPGTDSRGQIVGTPGTTKMALVAKKKCIILKFCLEFFHVNYLQIFGFHEVISREPNSISRFLFINIMERHIFRESERQRENEESQVICICHCRCSIAINNTIHKFRTTISAAQKLIENTCFSYISQKLR